MEAVQENASNTFTTQRGLFESSSCIFPDFPSDIVRRTILIGRAEMYEFPMIETKIEGMGYEREWRKRRKKEDDEVCIRKGLQNRLSI